MTIQHPTYCIQWEISKDTWPFQTPTASIPTNFSFSLHQPYSYPPRLDVYSRQQTHQQSIMEAERRDHFYPDLWPTTKGIQATSPLPFPVWAVERGFEEEKKFTIQTWVGKKRSAIKLIWWKVSLILLYRKSNADCWHFMRQKKGEVCWFGAINTKNCILHKQMFMLVDLCTSVIS